MSSNDYETECVSSDVIKHRRQERGGLKAALTLKMRKIKDLMSVQNVAEVETTLHEIRNSMSNLFIKNDELIKTAFSDPSEIALAKKYMDEVETDYNKLTDDVNVWLKNRQGTPDEIKAGDSASQTGKSNVSTSSSRVKLKAKKAALLAKAQLLERQQELKRKQAELELAQEKLTLECEIKATDAEERVYEEFELGVIEKTFDVPVPVMRNLDESNKKVEQRPIRSPLNPFAQPWSGRREAGQMTENLDTMDRFQCDLTEPRQVIQGESSSILMMQQKMLDAVQLPRSELIRFDGDPLKYWMFIRSFESHVGQTSVGSSAKLNRLLSYCTGKALSVIECCSVMEPDEGYTEALSLLKSRFGNHHVISNAWVDKVTGGPWLRPGDNEGLRRYADDLRSAMLTLKAMGKVNEIDNQVRMVKIVSKLPNYLQSRWRRKVSECLSLKGEYPKIDALVSFVKQAADEANDPVFGMMSGSRHKDENLRNWPRGFDKKGANYNVQASERVRDQSFFKSPSCPMCSGGHALFMCERFRNMRPEMRHDFVVDKRLCFNCFYDNHLARDCRKPSKCHIQGCTRKHSRLIHLPLRYEGIYQRRTDTRSSELPKLENPFEAQSSNVSSRMSRVALPVVRVQVSAGNGGKRMWTYALLDSGSTNSFCSNTLLVKLGVEVSETELSLTTLEKVNSKAHTRMTSLFVTDADNRTTLEMPHVFGTANLSANVNEPVDEQNVDLWNHLKGLKFPCVNKVNVGLLIGQDVPTALTPVDVRTGSTNEPYAVKTALGWVLNGPMADVRSYEVMTHYACTDQSLEAQVERFWKMDTCDPLATNARGISVEDKRTLTIWDNSARVVDGHYELSIPFKSNPPCLQNNFSVAESRLDSLKRRFMKDNKLFEKYRSGIKELVDKGFAEKVQEIDVNRSGQGAWYIPHHAVVNEHKPEKLRVVFDCSAKYCGTSLNEQVYQGPDLTNKLMGVLLRFREGPIGVMGDIDAMFHQVKVPELDRDYLRFLWFSDTGQHPDVFRMTVHLFGGVWSPSCASYALRRTAEDNKAAFDSDVVQTVLDNFYVDDCLRSLQGEHEAIQLIQRLCGLLSRGGFSLNKWITNNRTVLSCIPEERRAKTVKGIHLCGDKLPAERALGVLWDTEKDEFGFRIAVKSRPMTRRGMLSIIGSVYDPLGLVSPFVLQAKKIFQSESRMRKGWDEHLSQTNSEKWIKWLSDLPKLEMCRFPRCMSSSSCPELTKYELHHFSDASCEGYGAVSYLREVNDDGSIHCDLITSKSRLAPLKQMTIPRLELSAAVISVKLDVMLRCELKLPVDKSVFWTDSTVVIQYIKNENKRFHLFVANRIALIRDSSEPNQWKHVDSANNPADDVSRGLDADQMVSSVRWKHGPKFLSQPDSEWSVLDVDMKISDSDKEVKRETKVYSVATNESCDLLDELFKRYSSWYRLKRSVAWLLRLKQILLNKAHRRKYSIPDSGLTVSELKKAEHSIVQVLQRKMYSKELLILKAGKFVGRNSSLYRLGPILCHDTPDILCVSGRLQTAPISTESKHPMILPRDNHVTRLIIRHFHERSGHSGTEYVLSLIRQQFWIPKGRKCVSKLLSGCVDCKKRQGMPNVQRMADLPSDRVSPGDPPFTSVGLDCFGPFIVRRGRSETKRYGCIFTCLATRAIHLEKLDGLDTVSFLNGFIRFISRRGCPKKVRSDNGTNFRGAEAELRRGFEALNSKQTGDFMIKKEIEWVFNPPGASHMGGVWERLIRTVRAVMNALLKTNRPLDDDGLNTLLCEIESIVNGRPITVVPDSPKDFEALTPNHLLLLKAGPNLSLESVQLADIYKNCWKHVQFLADLFWRRWVREYLPTLQIRQKWMKPKRNISIDDIVLILNENCARKHWPLGRVVETYPGKDGLVRSVLVRTKNSTLVRPINKLCLLEGVGNNN